MSIIYNIIVSKARNILRMHPQYIYVTCPSFFMLFNLDLKSASDYFIMVEVIWLSARAFSPTSPDSFWSVALLLPNFMVESPGVFQFVWSKLYYNNYAGLREALPWFCPSKLKLPWRWAPPPVNSCSFFILFVSSCKAISGVSLGRSTFIKLLRRASLLASIPWSFCRWILPGS